MQNVKPYRFVAPDTRCPTSGWIIQRLPDCFDKEIQRDYCYHSLSTPKESDFLVIFGSEKIGTHFPEILENIKHIMGPTLLRFGHRVGSIGQLNTHTAAYEI